jgi:hypothetical protein
MNHVLLLWSVVAVVVFVGLFAEKSEEKKKKRFCRL